MQESIVEQVKIPVYKGSLPNPTQHPSQPGTSAKKKSWEDDRKTCSLSESVPEGCFRQFSTFVRLQLDYICFHLTD